MRENLQGGEGYMINCNYKQHVRRNQRQCVPQCLSHRPRPGPSRAILHFLPGRWDIIVIPGNKSGAPEGTPLRFLLSLPG